MMADSNLPGELGEDVRREDPKGIREALERAFYDLKVVRRCLSSVLERHFYEDGSAEACKEAVSLLVESGALLSDYPDTPTVWRHIGIACTLKLHDIACYLFNMSGAFFLYGPSLGRLLVSAGCSSPETLEVLIAKTADINHAYENRSGGCIMGQFPHSILPVAYALQKKNIEALKHLLLAGADFNYQAVADKFDVDTFTWKLTSKTSDGKEMQVLQQVISRGLTLIKWEEFDMSALPEGRREEVRDWLNARAEHLPRALMAGHPRMFRELVGLVSEYI